MQDVIQTNYVQAVGTYAINFEAPCITYFEDSCFTSTYNPMYRHFEKAKCCDLYAILIAYTFVTHLKMTIFVTHLKMTVFDDTFKDDIFWWHIQR